MQHTNGRTQTIITRSRLMALGEQIDSHPITLISAPSGCGKSTLAAQFAAAAGTMPVVWHGLTSDQRDISALHLAAMAAVGTALPHAELPPPSADATPERLARDLLRFLSLRRGGVLYVLEDIHQLAGAERAEDWLEAFIAHLPANVRLIMTSETVPNSIPRERIARQEVLPINAAALAFTPDEALALAHLLQAEQTDEAVLALRDKLDGWAAGLALALRPGVRAVDDELLAEANPEALFALLARRLFVVQPPPMQDFLLAASALDVITPEVLISALKLPGVMARLAQAQEAGLFLTTVPGGVIMHRLFRAFLQRESQARHPDRWRAVHRAVAAWHEDRLNIDAAVRGYLAAGDHDDALRLIDLYARTLYDQGQREILFRWEVALEAAGTDSAWLRYLCATLMVSGMRYAEGQARIERARVLFSEAGDSEGLMRVTLTEAHIALMRGALGSAHAAAESLLGAEDLPPNLYASALRLRALARLYAGQTAVALVDFEKALPLYEQHCDQAALTRLLGDMDIAYRRAGRAQDAAQCLSRIVTIRRTTPGQADLPTALNQYGVLLHMQGDLVLAREMLGEGAILAVAQGDRRAEAYLRWSMGDLERDRANFDEAIGHYNNALRLAGEDEPLVRCGVLISLSVLLRWRGDALDALSHLGEAEALAEAHHLVIEGLQATIARCALAPLSMPAAQAIAVLIEVLDRLRAMHATTEATGAMAVLVLLQLLNDDRAAAERTLETISRAIRADALPQLAAAEIAFAPPPLGRVLKDIGRRGEALHTAVQVLRKYAVRPANILNLPTPDASSTTSLTVYLLGREIYERDGGLILHTEWRAHVARAFFLTLLLQGPQRREALSLKLFSGTDQTRIMRSSFHVTLHRARHVLGANVIQFRESDQAYLINPEVSIWCDAHRFEQAVRDARGKPRRDPMIGEMWRRARALYHGILLPDHFTDWVLEYRHYIDELYLEALVVSGDIAHERLDFATAEELYRKALSMDELSEDLHLRLMRAWRDAGQTHRIQPHYDAMTRLFLRELGRPPSPKISQWIRNLTI